MRDGWLVLRRRAPDAHVAVPGGSDTADRRGIGRETCTRLRLEEHPLMPLFDR